MAPSARTWISRSKRNSWFKTVGSWLTSNLSHTWTHKCTRTNCVTWKLDIPSLLTAPPNLFFWQAVPKRGKQAPLYPQNCYINSRPSLASHVQSSIQAQISPIPTSSMRSKKMTKPNANKNFRMEDFLSMASHFSKIQPRRPARDSTRAGAMAAMVPQHRARRDWTTGLLLMIGRPWPQRM